MSSRNGFSADGEDLFLQQLEAMGFSENACRRGLMAVRRRSAEAAASWILDHVSSEDLERPLTPPSSPRPTPPRARRSSVSPPRRLLTRSPSPVSVPAPPPLPSEPKEPVRPDPTTLDDMVGGAAESSAALLDLFCPQAQRPREAKLPRPHVPRGEKCCTLLDPTVKAQPCFYCYECGLTSQGICEACARQCHAGHIVKGGFGSFEFQCECGLLAQGRGSTPRRKQCFSYPELCSFVQTGKNYTVQPFYTCRTCHHEQKDSIWQPVDMLPNEIVTLGLLTCAMVCHAGHDVVYARTARMFCDCGCGNHAKPTITRAATVCRCMPESDDLANKHLAAHAARVERYGHPLCTVLMDTECPPLQPNWGCRTCGIKKGLCQYCAAACHEHHDTFQLDGQHWFNCLCGSLRGSLPAGAEETAGHDLQYRALQSFECGCGRRGLCPHWHTERLALCRAISTENWSSPRVISLINRLIPPTPHPPSLIPYHPSPQPEFESQLHCGGSSRINERDLTTALYQCCLKGNAAAVRLILNGCRQSLDPNEGLRYGAFTESPLYAAAARGDAEVVGLLLGHPVTDVNLGRPNQTPLWAAIIHSTSPFFFTRPLNDIFIGIIIGIPFSPPPRAIAVVGGHEAVVEMLLRHPDIKATHGFCLRPGLRLWVSPLYAACQRGSARVAEMLLQTGGFDPSAGEMGLTPLYIALDPQENIVLCTDDRKNGAARKIGGRVWSEEPRKIGEGTKFRVVLNFVFYACDRGFLPLVRLLASRSPLDPNRVMLHFVPPPAPSLVPVPDPDSPSGAPTQTTTDRTRPAPILEYPLLALGGVLATWLPLPAAMRGTPLAVACERGHLEVVEELLKMPGIEVNKAENGLSPLSAACQYGHGAIVQRLVKVPGLDPNRGNPLALACRAQQLPIVECLLQAPGIELNKGPLVPLHVAAQTGNVAILRALLESGHADINFALADQTALTCACTAGQPEAAALLLGWQPVGANPNLGNPPPLVCLAHLAARRPEVAEELLDMLVRAPCRPLVDVTQTDSNGDTFLHAIAAKGAARLLAHLDEVDRAGGAGAAGLLLQQPSPVPVASQVLSASVQPDRPEPTQQPQQPKAALAWPWNAVDKDGASPLAVACSCGQLEHPMSPAPHVSSTPCLQHPMSQSPHVSITPCLNPPMSQSAHVITPQVVAALLRHSAVDPNAGTVSPLAAAIEADQTSVGEALLDTAGGEINLNIGCPLALALRRGHSALATRILDTALRLSATTRPGKRPWPNRMNINAGAPETALFAAVQRRDLALVLAILKCSLGPNPNLGDLTTGRTPLHAAVRGNSLALAESLLAAGADPGIKDHSGRTPLAEAATEQMRWMMQRKRKTGCHVM
ncbi:hypothetical protein PAPYR_2209 [Paratrimastix pyriformis]|uniref:UBA domain-containing protein n=1 Tax=Paratrimastix pyriformis TaxID=342808 RepID=A0ABQ8USX9_9EUKA|nr:hypothetical protein PAPYR_2209 [Paratrimastix pyriformis]